MWLGRVLVFNTDPWSVAAEEGEWVVRVPGYLRPPRQEVVGPQGPAGSLSLECCGKPEESFTFSFSPFPPLSLPLHIVTKTVKNCLVLLSKMEGLILSGMMDANNS